MQKTCALRRRCCILWRGDAHLKTDWYKCRRLIFIPCLFLLVSCATPVQRSLESFTENPALLGAHAGVALKSLTDDAYLFRSNDEQFFIPASNMKLFTTAAGLMLLGPEFRYTTSLYADGEIRDGLLNGDLIIRGVGDPTLSGRFHTGGADDIFSGWAETLLKLGVKEIRGNVVGDGSLFGEEYLGAGWAWDDDLHCYSAQISALSINDNCVAVSVRPGTATGETPFVTVDDGSGYVTIRNQAATTSSTLNEGRFLRLSREAASNLLTISGEIPTNANGEQLFVTIHNPALFAAAHLRRVLESKGIAVGGRITDRRPSSGPFAYASMKIVASYTSPPLREVISKINKASRNLYAELLFRTLGNNFRGDGSARAAAEVLYAALAKMSVPPGSVVVYDGSGLSRMNLVTPAALLALLEYMYRHEHFSYFLDSLPVAGIDGTLRDRMRNTPGEGSVQAKTGSMTHVLNLSGYVRGREGKLYAFSIMTNNYTGGADVLKRVQDSALARLVSLLD
jgi:serine-type D-Ala-D-Ala carboxypeptidase/endopeptidase (penicillin-binding protein 4)